MAEGQAPGPTGWIAKLGARWGVAPGRVFLILLVFACTGTTVLLLKRPVVSCFVSDGAQPLGVTVLYYILILPIYNVLLLVYGALLGQFQFFWDFEKRFFRRIFGIKGK
jgi:hypothetical protein